MTSLMGVFRSAGKHTSDHNQPVRRDTGLKFLMRDGRTFQPSSFNCVKAMLNAVGNCRT